MLLKALLLTMAFFAGSVGVLRASVVLENYILLAAGLLMATAAVVVGLRPQGGVAAA